MAHRRRPRRSTSSVASPSASSPHGIFVTIISVTVSLLVVQCCLRRISDSVGVFGVLIESLETWLERMNMKKYLDALASAETGNSAKETLTRERMNLIRKVLSSPLFSFFRTTWATSSRLIRASCFFPDNGHSGPSPQLADLHSNDGRVALTVYKTILEHLHPWSYIFTLHGHRNIKLNLPGQSQGGEGWAIAQEARRQLSARADGEDLEAGQDRLRALDQIVCVAKAHMIYSNIFLVLVDIAVNIGVILGVAKFKRLLSWALRMPAVNLLLLVCEMVAFKHWLSPSTIISEVVQFNLPWAKRLLSDCEACRSKGAMRQFGEATFLYMGILVCCSDTKCLNSAVVKILRKVSCLEAKLRERLKFARPSVLRLWNILMTTLKQTYSGNSAQGNLSPEHDNPKQEISDRGNSALDELQEYTECSICFNSMAESKIFACSNDHWMCEDCSNSAGKECCPFCKEDFGNSPPRRCHQVENVVRLIKAL